MTLRAGQEFTLHIKLLSGSLIRRRFPWLSKYGFIAFLSCRLNSAIIGTPITLFTTNYHYTHTPNASSRGRGKGAGTVEATVHRAVLATDVDGLKMIYENVNYCKHSSVMTTTVDPLTSLHHFFVPEFYCTVISAYIYTVDDL